MNIVFILLPLATLISLSFLIALLLSIRSGQFDDLDSESTRLLFLNPNENKIVNSLKKENSK